MGERVRSVGEMVEGGGGERTSVRVTVRVDEGDSVVTLGKKIGPDDEARADPASGIRPRVAGVCRGGDPRPKAAEASWGDRGGVAGRDAGSARAAISRGAGGRGGGDRVVAVDGGAGRARDRSGAAVPKGKMPGRGGCGDREDPGRAKVGVRPSRRAMGRDAP